MPITRSDPRPSRRAALAACLALGLASCTADVDDPTPSGPGSSVDAPGTTVHAPDVARRLSRLLAGREDAVRDGDRATFLTGVASAGEAFARLQASYFDNLAALPVAEFGLHLDRTSLVREGGDYWAEVDVSLQLDGYDDVPVVTRDRYRFTPARHGRFLLASTQDRAWEQRNAVDPQPWETGPVTVVRGTSVLGIFDQGSAGQAGAVMADVQAGVSAVRAEVPYDWDGRVVVYALSDPVFLDGLEGLPGDDPTSIDAVTFPVVAGGGSAEVASTRFILNPSMVATPGPARRRLVRHELTHVALGDRQTGVPTWFTEGLAEYVSVQPLAPAERAIPGAALDAAEDGVSSLPSDDEFNGSASQANYGIAWWACESIAETYDESMLWTLLDDMSGPEGADGALPRVLGINAARLARKAARLMLDTYRPEPEKSKGPKPSKSPSPGDDPSQDPSEEPTDEPSDG